MSVCSRLAAGNVYNLYGSQIILGASELVCGEIPGGPATYNSQTKFYGHLGEGQWQAVSDFLQPPE